MKTETQIMTHPAWCPPGSARLALAIACRATPATEIRAIIPQAMLDKYPDMVPVRKSRRTYYAFGIGEPDECRVFVSQRGAHDLWIFKCRATTKGQAEKIFREMGLHIEE